MRDKHDRATKSTSPKNKKTKESGGIGVGGSLARGGLRQAEVSTLGGGAA